MKRFYPHLFVLSSSIFLFFSFNSTGNLPYGYINYLDNSPAVNHDVNYYGLPASGSTSTDNAGLYTIFETLTIGEGLTITPVSPTTCAIDNVNILDVIKIQQHIFNIAPISCPYGIIAANVNDGVGITSHDIILLHQLITQTTNAISNSVCYRYVPADYVFPNPSNPWSPTFPDSINFIFGTPPIPNFIAIPTGDVSICEGNSSPTNSNTEIRIDYNASAASGSSVSIPVQVNNFSDILGTQFSIQWDPSVLTFVNTDNISLPNLGSNSLGLSQTASGILTCSWTEQTLNAVSLADGSIIFDLVFDVVGAAGSSTAISVNSVATEALVVDVTETLASPNTGSGTLTVTAGQGPGSVTINALDQTTVLGQEVCVPITVENFTNIPAFQFSINYDASDLQFSSINPVAPLSLFTASNNFSVPSPGTIATTWASPTSTAVSLPDQSVLFEICFISLTLGNTQIDFSDTPAAIEFVDENGDILVHTTNSGTVSTGFCPPDINQSTDSLSCQAQVNITVPNIPPNHQLVNDYNDTADASDTYPLGNTLVNYVLIGPGGDSIFCSFNVNISDQTAPSITCPDHFSVAEESNSGGAFPTWVISATDNCMNVDTYCNLESGRFLPCGTHSIDCIAFDAADNRDSCSFNITVDCAVEPNCSGLSLELNSLDSINHGCCYSLDFNNTSNTPIYAINLKALGGMSIDYELSDGFFTPNFNLFEVLLSPHPLGQMPNNASAFTNICLDNVYHSPQELVVEYWDENYSVFCTDTLTLECPVEANCLEIVSDSLVCDSLGYSYNVDITIPNGSDFDIGLIKMNVTAPAALAGSYPLHFPSPLSAGDQAQLNFQIPSTLGYTSLDSLCFILTAHNGPDEQLCCFALDHCLPFPNCDPCADVSANAIALDSCCYRLELDNGYTDAPAYFTQIQSSIISEGAQFSAISYDLTDGWVQDISSTNTDILWNFSNSVPLGSFNFFDFCVDGPNTTDSICMAISWLNAQEIICTDTIKVFCAECINITEQTINCDENTGNYNYSFSAENWSGSYDANTITFVENDPRFDIQPNSLSLGASIPPYGSFGPLSVDIIPITAQAGDTICFEMGLKNIIQDSINIECCYLTHCIVLPECAPPMPLCSCDSLENDAACVFNIAVNCYDISLTPNCLLDECDEVQWVNQNGVPLGTTFGNQTLNTSVPGPGIYTFLYQITRTDDFGDVCISDNIGQNVTVADCSDCPNISCVPPAEIELYCNELPANFLTNSDFEPLFGAPTADNCANYTWTELTPLSELDNCGVGTLTRYFSVNDFFGNSDTCQQTISIQDTSSSYRIRFPADYMTDCNQLSIDISNVLVDHSACDLIAVSYSQELAPSLFDGICYFVDVTYEVINWCDWDPSSSAVDISRDADCDQLAGEEAVWLIVDGNNVYTDSDNDPYNSLPAANTRGTSCDGNSNPSGHWQNSSNTAGLNTLGYWRYIQRIGIEEPTNIDYIASNNSPYCIDNAEQCTASVQLEIEIPQNCLPSNTTSILTYNENDDTNVEATFSLAPDGSNTLLSGMANISFLNTYPNWTIVISDVPMGNHMISIQGQNDCGGVQTSNIPFEVIDCLAPTPVCVASIIADLQDLNPPVDINGDGDLDEAAVQIWATDLIEESFENCSLPLSYSINESGAVVDQTQTSIYLVCDDFGLNTLEVYAWDAAGNSDACISQVSVNDPNGFCPDLPITANRVVYVYPNPANNQLAFKCDTEDAASIRIRSINGHLLYQKKTIVSPTSQTIDISYLQPGVYYLSVQYSDGSSSYKRFVKM